MKMIRILLICYLILLTSSLSAKILFESRVPGGTLKIYVMNDNGSNVRRLMDNKIDEEEPRWSPDGKQVLFEMAGEIAVVDANGHNQQYLTDTLSIESDPAWSPNGDNIAFIRYARGGDVGTSNIHVMNLKTKKTKQLTERGATWDPSWSPNGRRIAYQYGDELGQNIWIMNADGSNKWRLSPPHPGFVPYTVKMYPRWSPDGEHVLYTESQYVGPGFIGGLVAARIIIQNVVTGKREIHTLPKGFMVSYVCWMSDGHEILASLIENRDVPTHIYRLNVKDWKRTQLTHSTFPHYIGDWKPDSLSVSPKNKLTMQWAVFKRGD